MGTTLVALLWEEAPASPTLWIAHVGDSRCYRLRSVRCNCSPGPFAGGGALRAGVFSQMHATASPLRNIITRAIGTQPTVEPEIAACDPQSRRPVSSCLRWPEPRLDEAAIARILIHSASPTVFRRRGGSAKPGLALQAALDTACHALVDAANANGGHDNITVLLLACS